MKHSKSKENKTKEVFEKVVNSVQTIIDNGEYEKFLKFQNSFRGYSFNNLVFIFSQFPNATHVAGKSKWLKLKRELIEQKNSKFKGNIYHFSEVVFAYNSNKIEGGKLTEQMMLLN